MAGIRIDAPLSAADSIETKNWIIRAAFLEEFELVKEMVVRIHLEIASEVNKEGYVNFKTEELPIAFPTLFSEDLWIQSRTWLCIEKHTKEVLGCLGIKPFDYLHIGITPSDDRIVEISYFYVEKKARGKGIGRMLLQHCIDWTKNAETSDSAQTMKAFIGLDLITVRHVMDIAIALYEQIGFRVYWEGGNVFDHLIRLRLTWSPSDDTTLR